MELVLMSSRAKCGTGDQNRGIRGGLGWGTLARANSCCQSILK